MLCIASKSLGIRTVVLEADARCPAAGVCDEFILGSITDASKIAQLAAGATVITCEIEHINADALTELGRCRPAVQIHPSADTVALIQDKYAQKLALADADVPCGKFQAVGGPADIEAAAEVRVVAVDRTLNSSTGRVANFKHFDAPPLEAGHASCFILATRGRH